MTSMMMDMDGNLFGVGDYVRFNGNGDPHMVSEVIPSKGLIRAGRIGLVGPRQVQLVVDTNDAAKWLDDAWWDTAEIANTLPMGTPEGKAIYRVRKALNDYMDEVGK